MRIYCARIIIFRGFFFVVLMRANYTNRTQRNRFHVYNIDMRISQLLPIPIHRTKTIEHK